MQYDLVNIEDNPVSKLPRYLGLQRADYRRILPGKSGPEITGDFVGKSLFLIFEVFKAMYWHFYHQIVIYATSD